MPGIYGLPFQISKANKIKPPMDSAWAFIFLTALLFLGTLRPRPKAYSTTGDIFDSARCIVHIPLGSALPGAIYSKAPPVYILICRHYFSSTDRYRVEINQSGTNGYCAYLVALFFLWLVLSILKALPVYSYNFQSLLFVHELLLDEDNLIR